MQGCGQGPPQSFAGHLQDTADAAFTRGRLKEQAGTAVEIEDLALAVDKRARQRDMLQQLPFGQFAQRYYPGSLPLSISLRDCRIRHPHRREEPARSNTMSAVNILFALI